MEEKKRFKIIEPKNKKVKPSYNKRVYDGSVYIDTNYTFDDK